MNPGQPCIRGGANIRPLACKRYNGGHISYLDLNIEHRMCVDLHTKRSLDVVCEPLLVALLDRSPLLLECRVVDVLKQSLECEVSAKTAPK